MNNADTETLHIAVAFDENYITPIYVLLTSIFMNNKQNRLRIHAIATGVDEAERNKIALYTKQNNASIVFYDISNFDLSFFVLRPDSHFTLATYYRLFFPALIPENIDKLLYLDSDIVVIGDLKKFTDFDLGSCPVAAIEDITAKARPELGIYDKSQYFNAGVLLINVAEWKRQCVMEKSFQYLQDFPERLKWQDQDTLNAVLANNWYKLDKRFNVGYYDIPKFLARKHYNEFIKDKIIIHYTSGVHKPWQMLGQNKLRYLYHDYLKQSPHAHVKKYTDFKLTAPNLFSFARTRVIEALLQYPRLNFLVRKWTGAKD